MDFLGQHSESKCPAQISTFTPTFTPTSRVRAVMLDTALQPYTDIADLYIVDPDGFVIR